MFRTLPLSIIRSFPLYTDIVMWRSKSTIQINQPDATISQVYYLTFNHMYSSTCFGRPHAHHQELSLLSIIRSFPLYTQRWYMSYRFTDSLRVGSRWNPSWSCSQAVRKTIWHTPLLCVQWKTPDDGQRNCPKYVEFHSKNKFDKLVHLVGFIARNLSYFLDQQ